MQKKIMGAEVKVGMKIKVERRIYLVKGFVDDDPQGWAILCDFEDSSGQEHTFNIFADSEYELRRDAPRPRLVKVRADDLLTMLEHCSTHDGTAAREAVKRVRQALTG
jgi:hypothetical protein